MVSGNDSTICVLGAGVVGLTTALVLVERGFTVLVAAHRFSPHTTSDAAAAVWYPYAVSPRDQALVWSRESFVRFRELSVSDPALVAMVEFRELFTSPVDDPWWGNAVDSFRFLNPGELPPGYVSGYSSDVPVIEATPYLKFLEGRLRDAGAVFRRIDTPATSFGEFEFDTIVNCCGLGAATLCSDAEMFPIRGQVLRIRKMGISQSFADDERDDAPTYIVPRLADCILGGTATRGDSNQAARVDDSKSILERCARIVPELANAEVLETKVGLRPGRRTVRLERERIDTKMIVHNYGHGGAGFTLSWGCAAAACNLIPSR